MAASLQQPIRPIPVSILKLMRTVPNREKALSDSVLVGEIGKKLDMKSVFIDCGKRPNNNLKEIANSMGANYVSLPRTNATKISNLVQTNLGI